MHVLRVLAADNAEQLNYYSFNDVHAASLVQLHNNPYAEQVFSAANHNISVEFQLRRE
jgi:hypothetical protein